MSRSGTVNGGPGEFARRENVSNHKPFRRTLTSRIFSRWMEASGQAAALALIVATGAASPAAATSSIALPRFEPGGCPSRVAATPAFAHARCGQLIVPENRHKHNGKTLSISVAIIPSVTQPPKHEPLFYITGGPGGDAMGDMEFLVPALTQDQNLIVLAQRGTLDAKPSLLCPEIDAFNAKAVSLPSDTPSTGVLHVAATKACHDRFVSEGVDLSAYNTLENIEDLVDLRKVLGVTRWSLFGTSYGTYVALLMMRLHPQGLVSVTIDSISPPSVAGLGWPWSSAGEGFKNLFDACAAQPSCASKYGDVRSKFTSQVQQLEASPLTITSHYAQGGPPVRVVLDGGALVSWLVAGGRQVFASAPSAIQELEKGAPAQIAAARAALANPATESTQGYGLTYGVFCSEWIPFQPQSQILADGLAAFPTYPRAVLSQTPQLPFTTEDCAVWDVPKAPAFIKDVTTSAIPTLVINGAFDGKTSPMWATYVAKTLRNSTTLIIPGVGHLVTAQSPCAQTVVREFLANPTTPPDTSCAARVTIPSFK
jgi:pimeloyl-ACP methyl ester carboxylesterase